VVILKLGSLELLGWSAIERQSLLISASHIARISSVNPWHLSLVAHS
jgi:hypothetical protein